MTEKQPTPWRLCKVCKEPMIGIPKDADIRDRHNVCGGKSKVE